jgi:hypothetical protein
LHGDVSLQKAPEMVCEPTHFRHIRYCLRALNVTRPSRNRLRFLYQALDFANAESLGDDSLCKFGEGGPGRYAE